MTDEVSRLRTDVATLQAQREADVETMRVLQRELHDMATDVRTIKDTVVRSRGFLAGATFVVVTVWSVLIGGGLYIYQQMTN